MTAETAPVLSRRRVRRILYPAGARRVLPKEDRDPTLCWLLLLSAILFFQIYTEDGRWDTPSSEGAVGQGDGIAERHWEMSEGDTSQPCGLNLHMHMQQHKCSE
ncbi:radiation-inducible immediate-early gene IEX-1 [Tachysurus ichikawai]